MRQATMQHQVTQRTALKSVPSIHAADARVLANLTEPIVTLGDAYSALMRNVVANGDGSYELDLSNIPGISPELSDRVEDAILRVDRSVWPKPLQDALAPGIQKSNPPVDPAPLQTPKRQSALTRFFQGLFS